MVVMRRKAKEEYQIVGNRTLSTTIDTVNGCSPYIFNCSLRSVFGLCGMHTDGSKVENISSRWLLHGLRVSLYKEMVTHSSNQKMQKVIQTTLHTTILLVILTHQSIEPRCTISSILETLPHQSNRRIELSFR